MKRITLLCVLLIACCWQGQAQTTHNLDWYMGITSADASLTIDAGDTVIWTFTDASSHSVTSDTGSTEAFDSGIITAGSTYSYTFTTAGTNPYHCDVHPSMIGTITVNAAPASCLDPTAVTSSNITINSTDLDWTENGTATLWDIEIGPQGFTPTGTPTHDNVSKPYTISGLTALTIYDVYLRSDCGSSTSAWVGPTTFSTACGIFPSPFLEDFETSTTNLPGCWQSTSSTTREWDFDDSPSSSNTYDDHTTGTGYFAYVDGSSTTTPDATLTMPPVDVSTLTTPMLEFYVHHFDNNSNQATYDDNTITVEVFDGTAWQQIYVDSTADVDGWQLVQINLTTYVSAGPMQIRFVVKTDLDTNFYNDIAIDDISFKEAPSCFQPLALTATNITENAADLGWSDGNTPPATTWDIEVVTAGTASTGTPTDVGVTANPYTKTGLTANTDYEFYVRADCGATDGASAWSGPFAFTTPCPTTYIPAYSEDFTESVAPDCWTEAGSGTPATGPSGTTGGWLQDEFLNVSGSSNQAARINLAASSDEEWLISPAFDLSGGSYELAYVAALTDASNSNPPEQNGMGSDDEVQVLISTDGGTTWTNLKTYNQSGFPSHTGDLEVIDLSAYTGTATIAFWANEGSVNDPESSDFFIDDFHVRTLSNCPQPTDLIATLITNSSADFAWTENGTAAAWDIEMVLAGTPPTGTPTDAGVISNPYNKTGLTANTDYEFYVRADCGSGDTSYWTGPYAFTTLCSPFGDFVENFDTSATSGMPDCWTTLINSTASASTVFIEDDSGDAYSGSNYLEFYDSSGDTGDYFAITPQLTALSAGTHQMRFQAKSDATASIEVGTMSDPTDATTFTVMQTITLTTSYMEYIVPFATITTDQYVAFKGVFTATYDYIEVDDVNWETVPSCTKPSSLTATNILATSADLGWTESGTATTWDIEVVTAGTTPTGTPTNTGVTSNPYNVTGLTAQTDYEFYVRADCGGGDLSTWSGPFAFTTPCAAATLPYLEDFTNFVPNCWEEAGAGSPSAGPSSFGSSSWGQDDFANTGSNQATDINLYTTGKEEWLISPMMDLSAGGYELVYDVAVTDYGNSNPSAMGSDDEVQVLISTDNGVTWTNLLTYNASNTPSNTGQLEIISLATYTSATTQFAFWASEGTVNDTEDYEFFIDNFEVRLSPSCSQPTALTATNILATSADLGWTESGTATTWDIEVVTAGTTPTGTPTDVGVTSNPYNVTGLTVNTNYEFYVRADCGGTNGLSPWSGPYAFYTGYCSSVPTSNDNNGITHIQIGSSSYTGTDITYLDFTATPADLYQSVMMNVKITFETGYTYDTNIWIDLNDDLIFDSTELVFTGASTNANPTTLDASFVVPASATLGTHGMRIGTADSGQSTPDPCYNGSYGVTADFTVNVIAAPSCLPPHTLTAASILATSADLGWTENNTPAATMWDIEVVPTGTAPTGTPTDVGVTTNPYNKTGLTANTGYDFYVRTDCGGGDTSPWSGPYTFFTACTPATLPYFEDFSGGSFPNCWSRTSTTNVTIEATCDTRTNVLRIDYAEEAVTGIIDITAASNGVIVSYYIADSVCGQVADAGEMFNVDYWDGTQWITAMTYDAARPDAYTLESFAVPASAVSSSFKLRFDQLTGSSVTTDSWLVDDISVELPPCYDPSDIIFNNITQTQADVLWTENGSATEWEIEYGTTGFTPGSGTILSDNDGTLGETITGLTAATIYDVYVRTLCTSGASGNTSGWVGPVSFTTACDAISTFPYVESFEASSGYRPCWTMEYVAGSEDWEFVAANQNGTIAPKTGASMAQFMTTNPGGVDVTKFVSPALDLSNVPSPQLKFYYANVSWMGDIDELRVYYKTSAQGTWTQIGTDYTAEQTAWTEVVLNLPNPSADYYVAFEGTSYYGRGLNVDDVSIEAASCPDPSDITVSNILTTAADISWTENGSATEWEIEYGANGFTPGDGTGTIVADTDGTLGETLTGLTAETSYDVYVTAICGAGDESNQVGPETFTTQPLGVNDQVFEGFTYYPNPVNSQLSLKATSEIQEVVVYDLLGQEVLKSKPNSLAPTLEFHNLQAGTYLMKVTIEGSVGVYRIIKE